MTRIRPTAWFLAIAFVWATNPQSLFSQCSACGNSCNSAYNMGQVGQGCGCGSLPPVVNPYMGIPAVDADVFQPTPSIGQPGVAVPGIADPNIANPGDFSQNAISAVPNIADPTAPQIAFNTRDVAFSGQTFAAFDSKAGYIDTAIISNQIRFRFDAAYDFLRPDRAEFFYTTWQQFGGKNPDPPLGFPDPHIDRQTLNFYYEHQVNRNLSLFVDLPIVFSDPLRNPNDSGVGDLQAGFKLSLLHDSCQQLTFQLKNYIPTADAERDWIGTGHYSIEPGILYFRQLNSQWSLESEIRDWIPIGGAEDYAGNVLRYGVGLGYDLGCVGNYRVKPIVEFVGWSVLDGQVFEFNDAQVDFTNNDLAAGNVGPRDASNDTIVNIKLGTRITNSCGGSLYVGYGHALTSDAWYEDIFRFELRKMF